MKKRVSSFLLATVMVLSAFIVVPTTVNAVSDTWNASATNITISTQNDWDSFVTYMEQGNTMSGKTITLATDVAFSRGYSINRYNWGTNFRGTLDGAGHSIDLTKTLSSGTRWNGGIFTELGDGAVVKNLKLTGTITVPQMWESDAGNRTYFGGIASVAHDTVLIQNVYNHLTIVKPSSGVDKMTRSGGFIGTVYSENSSTPCNLTFDGCIFDGSITNNISSSGGTSAFVGHTGYKSGVKNITFMNCVAGGTLTFTESGDCRGVFVGYTQIDGDVNLTFSDTLVFTQLNTPNVNNDGYLFGSGWGPNVNSVTYSNLYIAKRTNQGSMPDVGSGITAKTGAINYTTTEGMINAGTAVFSDAFKWGTKTSGDDRSYLPLPKYWADRLQDSWLFTDLYVQQQVLTIGNADELMTFATNVSNGNSYAGYIVKLTNDIDLSGKAWTGIGTTSSAPFSGSFDGQGHTISNLTESLTNPDGAGGLFNFVRVPANGTVTIKNFKLTGTITLNTTSSGKGYTGTVVSCVDAGTSGNGGVINIQNVWSGVNIQCNGTITAIGGIVGFTRHQDGLKPLTLNIQGCVYDGIINCANGATLIGGFVGYTGLNKAGRTLVINISESVFAGTLMFNDPANEATTECGLFAGYLKGDITSETVTLNINDCISVGKMTFNTAKEWKKGNQNYGVITSTTADSATKVNATNFYYLSVSTYKLEEGLEGAGDTLPLVCSGSLTSQNNIVVKETKREMCALELSDFTAPSNWKIDAKVHVSCPKYIANTFCAEALPETLYAEKCAVEASYRDTANNSGVLFTASYYQTNLAADGGTLDANFGLLLMTRANYDVAANTTTKDGLMNAHAVCIKATRYKTVDGIYTVSAVICNIPNEEQGTELVAIAYLGNLLSEPVFASYSSVNN